MLDGAKRSATTGYALAGLALVACVAGAVTTYLLTRQRAPEGAGVSAPFDASLALRTVADPAARRYLAYQLLWNTAIGVSGAYYALHMLENLRMGFTLIALHAAAVAGVRILLGPLWGRAIDRVGARPVLVATSFGIALILFTGPSPPSPSSGRSPWMSWSRQRSGAATGSRPSTSL